MKQNQKPVAFNLPRLLGLPFAPGIAMLYLLTAGLWIYYSDLAADWLTETPEQMRFLSTYKGLFFVAATAVLLFALVRKFVLETTLIQKDLQKREEQYRVLVENQTDLIVKTDPAGRFLFANRPYRDLIDQKEDELLGTTFTAFAHEQDLQPVLKPPHTSHLEQRVWVQNGWHWLEWKHNAVTDPSGKVTAILSIGRDITGRKQAEQTLQKTKELLESVTEGTSDAIYVKDLQGRYLMANSAVARFAGKSTGELLGKDVTALVASEDAQRIMEADRRIMESGLTKTYEETVFSDGVRRTFLATKGPVRNELGKVTGIFGVSRDITERKQASDALRSSEENLRITLNSIGDAVISTDTAGRVTIMNPVAERLTGWSLSDARNRPLDEIFNIINEQTRNPAANPAASVLATGAVVGLANHTLLIARDGRETPIADSGAPICDETGKISGVVLVFRDQTEERAARQAIEKSEARYRLLFENMTTGFALHEMIYDDQGNPKDYRWLQVNPAFELLTGLSAEKAVGHTARELLPDIELHWIDTFGKVAKTGEPVNFENYSKDLGKYFEVCVFCPEPDQFAVVFTDVTERITTRQNLEESRQLLRGVLDTMPDRVWWKDTRSAFLGCNLNFARDAGLNSPDQLIGKTDYDMCWKDQADHFVADDREVLQSGRPKLKIQEFQTQTDGQTRWIETSKIPLRDSNGQVIGTLGTYADITEEKKSKAEMQRLSTVVEQSPDAVIITTPDGIIQYVNPAFEVITGYSRQEAIGETPRILKSGQHSSVFYSNLWEAITSGKTWEGQIVNRRKNGDLYTEKASISPVRDPSGAISGYVAVKRDITEELIKDEQFRQRQKMEAIGQLAGGVAHDFNNILQAILGFSEILMTRLNRATEEYGHANEIRTAALRAADLTRQLLAFSRKQAVQLTAVDLNATIRNMEVLLAVLLGERIRLNINLADNLQPIHADHGQMTQVIMNLAVNARDAMPESGKLTITTENVTLGDQDIAALPGVDPGDFVCLSVTDTGCGMSKEVIDRLFEPFFTTKELGKGTGLGLSVVYGIVRQSKGGLTVYSQEGRGTSFKIYLPSGKSAVNRSITEPV